LRTESPSIISTTKCRIIGGGNSHSRNAKRISQQIVVEIIEGDSVRSATAIIHIRHSVTRFSKTKDFDQCIGGTGEQRFVGGTVEGSLKRNLPGLTECAAENA